MKRSNTRGGGGGLSAHKKRKAFGGFPYLGMACLLDVRKIKLLATILAGSLSRLILPVDYYCEYITTGSILLLPVHTEPVPSPNH